MSPRRTRRWAVAIASMMAVATTASVATDLTSPTTSALAAAEDTRPNIVVIMTDDQRIDTLETMPVVRRAIIGKGKNFTGVIPTSTCCPSRASFLTGNFAHTTRVYDNVGAPNGGWQAFKASGYEEQTLAVALQDAGYRTALFGKYLNGWIASDESYVPAGWDEFMAIRDYSGSPNLGAGAYYNYKLTGTQPTTDYGETAADYSTDVIMQRSTDFVEANLADGPFFLFVSTSAPHAPFKPAPRHIGSWYPAEPYDNAAVNETNMSDKPDWMQELSKVSRSYIYEAQSQTGQALRAVDEGVSALLQSIGSERDNTLFVFMSDNGLMWGEHRLKKKNQPYRWSTEVPLAMRWDGHVTAGSTGGLAANVDVSATVLDAAGIPNALSMEGRSLLSGSRKSMVLEAINTKDRPAYCGVRTNNWLYVRYDNRSGSELYDYRTDPLELRNRAGDPAKERKLRQLRLKAKDLCSPKPPKFTW